MSLTLEVAATANAIIAIAYFAISSLIAIGLVKQRRLGFNPLGTATTFIFFTCASGHSLHFIHYLHAPAMYAMDANLWQLMIVDSLTVIPAVGYLAQRRRYGLVIRGPHALLDFQRRLEVAESLREIGQDIAARTELDELLARVAHHARTLLSADYAVVTTQNGDRAHLQADGTNTQQWDPAVWAAIGEQDRSRFNNSYEPLLIQDVQLDATAQPIYSARHLAEGARSLLVVPLARGAAISGVLTVAYRGKWQLTREGVSAAAALASQAAVAVENARLIASLRRAEQLKDEFLSVAAHELKTPVTSLRGFAQLLLMQLTRGDTLDPVRMQRALRAIDSQSDKIARLIDQLLDVSRIETGHLALHRVPCDVVELVERTVAAIQPNGTPRPIQIQGLPSVSACVDPLRLEQVFTNLLDNAIKYSPSGGAVEIEITQPTEKTARFTVRDHGVGIPEESRIHIFERFFQARSTDQIAGMGLGLFICHQIVLLHEGSIEAEFPEDGGTRVIVTLPITSREAGTGSKQYANGYAQLDSGG